MGRVAAVTGAAHGIGRACAFRLAETVTEFSLVDRNEEGLLETATDLMKRAGRQPLQFVSDVTQPHEVHRIVAQTVQHFGRIDILVNCAGGADTKLPRQIEETPLEAWDAQVDLNLRSVFVFCREVVPIMRAGKYGRIVNISSAAGRSTGRTKLIPYTAAKAGVLGLTRELASPTSTIRRSRLWKINRLGLQVGTTFWGTEGGRSRSGRVRPRRWRSNCCSRSGRTTQRSLSSRLEASASGNTTSAE